MFCLQSELSTADDHSREQSPFTTYICPPPGTVVGIYDQESACTVIAGERPRMQFRTSVSNTFSASLLSTARERYPTCVADHTARDVETKRHPIHNMTQFYPQPI